jgi:NADH dehydrogenase
MCPHAEIVRGRAVGLDESSRTVTVAGELGPVELQYERLVLALGAVPRVPPVPGLAEYGMGFKHLRDAIRLRDHVIHQLELAVADRANAERHLTFVFVGAGFAGVEALAELHQLVSDAVRHYPSLQAVPQRWVLVDGGEKVLAEVPRRLSEYTAALLHRRGVDLRLSTTIAKIEADAVTLSDGSRLETETVVWAAGIAPNPVLAQLGVPTDGRGRVKVDSLLQVQRRENVWAIGDCARVPNLATPEQPDPPTCQHALRQARRLSKLLRGATKPYRYRSLGGGATLGRDKGIATVFGVKVRGLLGAAIIRAYHVHQVPLMSRRLRVLANGTLALLFRRDFAELGFVERPRAATASA